MLDPLGFVVVSLAAWRLAVLLVRESGPWGVALRLRELAGITHDDDGEPVGVPDSMPGAALGCVWCTSVWTGALMLVFWAFVPVVVWVLAVAAAAVVVEVTVGRLNRG